MFRVVSGIWLKESTHLTVTDSIRKDFQDNNPKYLHVGSCHAAKLLLKDGQNVPHCGGESLGIQHAEGAATLGNGDMMIITNLQGVQMAQ